MTNRPSRILIVDDEPQIIRFLTISLQAEGYIVSGACNAQQGLAGVINGAPDAVILDLGLPDMDGQDLLQRLRLISSVPILVLSVRSDEGDKVLALDNGANDYVTKPFGIRELLARLRALLRHQGDEPPMMAGTVLDCGDLEIRFDQREVRLFGVPVHLSRKEFDVLATLARNADRVVTQRQLLETHWGPSHRDDSHYLRILIGRLRARLSDDPARPQRIITEQGVGYRLRCDSVRHE